MNAKQDTEGPRLTRILGIEKNALHKIRISGTVGGIGSPTNTKIPHLRVHKPKTTVVGSTVVKTGTNRGPVLSNVKKGLQISSYFLWPSQNI